MKKSVMRIAGIVCLVVGVGASCYAAVGAAPEIDPSTGANALALVSGVLLIIRSRRH